MGALGHRRQKLFFKEGEGESPLLFPVITKCVFMNLQIVDPYCSPLFHIKLSADIHYPYIRSDVNL